MVMFLFWVPTKEGGGVTDSDPFLDPPTELCVLMRAVCSSDSAAHRDRGTKYH